MAEENKKQTKKQPRSAKTSPPAQSSRRKKTAAPRRRPKSTLRLTGNSGLLEKLRRNRDSDFKPDAEGSGFFKTRHWSKQQREQYLRWALYILTCIGCLTVQDVVLSQMGIFGATTDLAVCAILLITVLEGTEVGSVFVLAASLCYYFSGSAPTAWCIGLLTFLGVGATLFRQMYWHRSRGSVVLCAAIALWGYEIGLYVVGLMNGLTNVSRLNSFLITALLSSLAMIPLYGLLHRIGLIGGNTWKE